MSAEGINFFYTGLGLDTGVFGIFYDFNSGVNGELPSIPLASAKHSGIIQGDVDNFFGIEGTGDFSYGYVEISEPADIFSSNCAFIFTQEKIDHSQGVLFSNFQGEAIKSGFLIGINDANKLYFEHFTNNGPRVFTSLVTYSDKNAFAVSLSSNTLSFNYYNANSLDFETETFSIDSNYILQSNNWYLGTGLNRESYNGYMDHFIYLQEGIPESDLLRLFSGLYTYIDTEPIVIPGHEPQITGYSAGGIVPVTGVVDIYWAVTGAHVEEFDKTVKSVNLITGNVFSGEFYLEYVDDVPAYCPLSASYPVYKKVIALDDGTGIVDVEFVDQQQSISITGFNLYEQINITGIKGYTDESLPLYSESGDPTLIDQEVFVIDTGYLNSFGMSSVTYLWNRNTGDLNEVHYHTGTFEINDINKNTNFDASTLEFKSFKTFDSYDPEQINLFLNGVLQVPSGFITTGDFYNLGIDLEQDYLISGNFLIFNTFANEEDNVIIDVDPNINKIYTPNVNGSAYDIEGKLEISIHDYWFFINGQKLMSGIDYTGIDDYFAPIQQIIDTNGSVYAIGKYQNTQENSGIFYDYYDKKFLRGTSVYYLNGVRLGKEKYIEHSSKADLITGKPMIAEDLEVFYTKVKDFWEL